MFNLYDEGYKREIPEPAHFHPRPKLVNLGPYSWFSRNQNYRSKSVYMSPASTAVWVWRLTWLARLKRTRRLWTHFLRFCFCLFVCFFVWSRQQSKFPQSDVAITRDGIRGLESALCIFDLDTQPVSYVGIVCPLYANMWRSERQTQFKNCYLSG